MLVSLPFLVPVHRLPIPSFFEEAGAAALGLIAFAMALRRGHFPVPAISPWIAGLGLLMLAQPSFLPLASPELAWLQGLAALWAAAMMCVGASLRGEADVERITATLAFAMAAAVLVSAVASWGGGHRLALLHQPNLHANYQVLGLSCVAFLWTARRVPLWCALLAVAIIGSSLAISASRASLLELIWVAGVYALWSARRPQPRRFRALWMLATVLVVMGVCVFVLPDPVGGILAAKLADVFHSRELHVRLVEWEAALRIGGSSPWFGVGAGAYSSAQFATATPWAGSVPMQVEINAHNAVLHLFAETGAVGALMALLGVATWLVRALRTLLRDASLVQAWAVAGVGVELVHGLLEYPLWNVEFLGVAALLAGMGDPNRWTFALTKAARVAGTAAAFCGLALLAWTALVFNHVHDYWSGRPQDPSTIEAARRSLLRPYLDVAVALAMPLDRQDLDQKIAFNDRVVRTWPLRPVVQRQIVWLAMAGRDEEGDVLIEHMTRLMPASIVELGELVDTVQATELSADSRLRWRLVDRLP